jgi:hypothetical protein
MRFVRMHVDDQAAQVQIEAGEDVGAIASVLWLTLLRAWLTMVPGTTTSLHLQSIIRGLACSAYDYRGRTLSPCDPDAARMMHGLLSHAAYPKKAQPMASVILGDPKVFCALTCLVDVSVGVLAFGMTLPEACRALMQDLHNLDEEDTRKCTAFREAVDALQALGGLCMIHVPCSMFHAYTRMHMEHETACGVGWFFFGFISGRRPARL